MATSAKPKREKRDWLPIATVIAAALTVAASLIALSYTLRADDQGQITGRYNAAITNLGSASIEIRLGGVYALQRLMQDSSRDQSIVVAVLCAFVRDQSVQIAKTATPFGIWPPADIQAAMTVVGSREVTDDQSATAVDFSYAQLRTAQLASLNFAGADFTYAALTSALLSGTNLNGAALFNADLSSANLTDADLRRAVLIGANMANANLTGADLRRAVLAGANLAGANLTEAFWPAETPVPPGWVRNASTGRLISVHGPGRGQGK